MVRSCTSSFMHQTLIHSIDFYPAVWFQQLRAPRACCCHCCIRWFDRRKYENASSFFAAALTWLQLDMLVSCDGCTLTAACAGTVFADLARELSSWERMANPPPSHSADAHSISSARGSSSDSSSYHVHVLPEGAVKVSQSIFKATRPAAVAMMIHCMTQLLPMILCSSLACFKALRLVLPLLDLSKIITGT